MKRGMIYLGSAVVAGLLALSGCSQAMYSTSSGGYSDDMYAVHDRAAIGQAAQRRAEAERAVQQARREKYEAAAAASSADASVDRYLTGASDGNPYTDILADDYESAYERRLRGFESPTYKMPASYYNYRYGDAYNTASVYDPSQYNLIVMGDEVWVEPKYITSMFGTWGTPVLNFNFGFGSPFWYGYNDWYWGWRNYYWGGPYWGWNPYWDWAWGWNYPYWPGHGWWGDGYYPRKDVSYRPAYQRPSSGGSYGGRRPNSVTAGSGVSSGTSSQRPTSSYQYRGGQSGTRGTSSSYDRSGSTYRGTSVFDRNTGTGNSSSTYRNNSSVNSRPQPTYTPSSPSISRPSMPSGSYGRSGSGSVRSGGTRGR